MTNFKNLVERIQHKDANKRTLGLYDWSSDSWDYQVANARAARILARINGERLTMRQALWGY